MLRTRRRSTTFRRDARGGLPQFFRRFQPLLILTALIWAAFAVDVALGGAMTHAFGLEPRRLSGLDGVLAMPFLHANLEHLLANTAPLLVLGALIVTLAPRRLPVATAGAVLVGGGLLWVFGREYNHIGASGLVFGWFGFLVVYAAVERSWRAFLGAAAAIGFYGATIWVGLAPTSADGGAGAVSWEGHLFGLIGGAAAALAAGTTGARRRAGRPVLRPR